MASTIALPQLPGAQQQGTRQELQPASSLGPTPKLHQQLSLKSSPVRPEPSLPSTPPQHTAASKPRTGRVPFNWQQVAPGSTRASLCLPPPSRILNSPRVGPPTPHAEEAGDRSKAASSPQAVASVGSEDKSHAPHHSTLQRGPSSPETKLQFSRQGSMPSTDSYGQVSATFPQLPADDLEAAKMLGR